jgi:uncharacterized LabA/DUF88 family protein
MSMTGFLVLREEPMNGGRVMIFIDGSNFYRCLEEQFGRGRVDYGKLTSALSGQRPLVRTYYYNAVVIEREVPQMYQDQQRFLARLRNTPYIEVRLGRLVRRGETVVEKGVDVRLATDMLNMAFRNTYDTAILVSGDGDYADAVRAVKDMGKHVENAFCKTGSSHQLRQECDVFLEIDQALFNQCSY